MKVRVILLLTACNGVNADGEISDKLHLEKNKNDLIE